MEPKYNFYGVNIDTPLSLANNTSQWDSLTIGSLYAKTNGQVYIREIQGTGLNAEYGWRVVDAYFSQEDSIITYFRAFDLDGNFLPQASFGVNWSSVPDQISGGFKYPPEFGNRYYVPVGNNFPTPNTGGYTVQVLDKNNPSEGIAFGLYKQGAKHQALVISFRLFKLAQGYPNDLQMDLR
jgi:hypothetical protein